MGFNSAFKGLMSCFEVFFGGGGGGWGGKELQLHVLLTSELAASEYPTSRLGRFIPEKDPVRFYLHRRLVGPTVVSTL